MLFSESVHYIVMIIQLELIKIKENISSTSIEKSDFCFFMQYVYLKSSI